jgi:preprotein translocase subunit YajC
MFISILYPLADKTPTSPSGSGMPMLILFGGMIFLMYLFMIRPQSKQRKEHRSMLEALKKGDKIVTIGGIYGIVTNVKDKIVVVKVAEGVKLEILRSGIAQVVESKEDIKEETS